MFGFGKKIKTPLDEVINVLQSNLENNYKDEAHKAYKEAVVLFEKFKQEGTVPEKKMAEYAKKLEEYGKKLEGYGHYNNLEALRFTK